MKRALLSILFATAVLFPMSAHPQPTADITLYVVPEKEACRQSGYNAYSDETSSTCATLSIDDIAEWDALGYAAIQRTIPPGQISLGDNILGLLSAYNTAPKYRAEDRKAVVIVFDFHEFQNANVTLARKTRGNGAGILPKSWSIRMRNERRFIHHERADVFLPSLRTIWSLKLGDDRWILSTGQ